MEVEQAAASAPVTTPEQVTARIAAVEGDTEESIARRVARICEIAVAVNGDATAVAAVLASISERTSFTIDYLLYVIDGQAQPARFFTEPTD